MTTLSKSSDLNDDKDLLKECEAFFNKHTEAGAGQFIDPRIAGWGHKQWRNDNRIIHDPGSDPRHKTVVAVYFSKQKLIELLNSPGCDGVRIYFCKSRGKIIGKERKYRDVFLMPTVDGEDKFPIREYVREQGRPIPHDPDTGKVPHPGNVTFDATDGVLNASTPCPDHCSKIFMK